MFIRMLLAFLVLSAWPFSRHAPAHSASHAPASAPIFCLWLDPRPLPASVNPAAEAEVFEQTLARTVELVLPLDPSSAAAIHTAAAAFAERKPLLLRVDRFESGTPRIEFIASAEAPAAAAIQAHRDWLTSQRGIDYGVPCLELFVDVDALRHTFLDSFAEGRAGRVIHAIGVPNARSLALHGRWIAPDKVPLADPALPLPPASRRVGEYAAKKGPPLVRLDLSWNSRADEPAIVRGMNIAAGHWPAAQLRMDPPAAPFMCIFRANFRNWLARSLMLRAAWLEPEPAAMFEQSCAAWLRANRPSIDRITGSLPGWLLVHPSERLPQWFIAQTPLRAENASPDPIVREFDDLVRKQFGELIGIIPDGGSRFESPRSWPISVIGWKPAPRPALSTFQFRIDLRGGAGDSGK